MIENIHWSQAQLAGHGRGSEATLARWRSHRTEGPFSFAPHSRQSQVICTRHQRTFAKMVCGQVRA